MNCLFAGASGLIGKELVLELTNDSRFSSITVVARAPLKQNHKKIKTILADFNKLDQIALPQADVAFCCLGTTIKKAGSKDAFFVVDHDYVIRFAKSCYKSGVKTFVVVSALGANAQSKIFYNKVKGQTEEDLKSIQFQQLVIIRPSLLLGERTESRHGEFLGQLLSPLLSVIMIGPLAKSRPIEASKVAKKMLVAATEALSSQQNTKIILNHEI